MKLYAFPPSPRARKPLAVAAHLDLPVELVFLDMGKGDHKTPEYLKLNPNGRMPTLVDGDFVLWESDAICQYLASKKGGDFYPADERARADITRWLCWDQAHWDAACAILLFENMVKGMFGGGAPDAAKVKEGEDRFRVLGATLDAHLSGRDYLLGKNLTVADFAIAAPLQYARRCNVPWENFGHVRRWYGQIEKLEAWQKTAPQNFA